MHPDTRTNRLAPALGALLAVGLGGCGGIAVSQDSQYADEALDSVDVAQVQASLAVPAVSDATSGMTPEQVAQTAQGKVDTYYAQGCATATAVGPVVTYRLTNCTGPHGLARVTGTVVVAYSAGMNGLQAVITSQGLRVNGAVVDVNATVVYSESGGLKKLVVASSTKGTGVRGYTFTHTGGYTFTWDATCATLDGAWQTKSGTAEWSTTVAGYKRCSGACPASGGSIVYTSSLTAVTVTVTLDGTNTAKWVSSRGRSGTAFVNCN